MRAHLFATLTLALILAGGPAARQAPDRSAPPKIGPVPAVKVPAVLKRQLQNIRSPIPAAELENAKSYLALQLPRAFETTGSVAASLEQMFVYNLPENYFATYTDRVKAVTAADLQRVADRHIQPDKFAVVVVGDRKQIEPRIAALKLGPIRIVTIDEVMK